MDGGGNPNDAGDVKERKWIWRQAALTVLMILIGVGLVVQAFTLKG
jgi:hypothetical protein